MPPPGQKRSRDILISVDLRTVSRNIIQILNWKRYLAIVNACGSFHRGAPRVKPAPATESYSRDAPPTRETRPRNFFSLSSPSPLPSSNRVKSIELSIYHTFLRLDSPSSSILEIRRNLHLDFSSPTIYRDFFFNGNFSLDSMVLVIFLFHEIFFRSTIQRLCLLDNFFFE